ncbi:MAG: cofactor-independent phosphoglycerate mutase [Prevotella sp.]|nr:cofactor-independent phosphoglycerate mutase [Prevotella sp.]
MKHIIILGDGMADHAVARLDGKTLLQYADTPYMDMLARRGRTGRLMTIPDGFLPGSEVANSTILGYDQNKVYEGRGPLEAASIGYRMAPEDLALRCNIINVANGRIVTHNGGNLTTDNARPLIDALNNALGNDRIKFITGIQYRHLLIVKYASKHIECAPPHDHPDEEWQPLLVKPEKGWENRREPVIGFDGKPTGEERMTAQETADLLNDLIRRSQEVLEQQPYNRERAEKGERTANLIWPWGGGYRPSMKTLMEKYPQIKSGSCISAVDLIRGIGQYAGLNVIKVPRATGLANTNYEGKVAAALDALYNQDFVFVHFEASDEAGHDGNLTLKLQTIENLDHRVVEPIYNEVKRWDEPVAIAVMPDHPTPVEVRTHVKEPVPFLVWHRGIEPDDVQVYDEVSCVSGAYGMLHLTEFMDMFINIE